MICVTQKEVEAVLDNLKTTECPHCKRVGTLIRHGILRGNDDQHQNKGRQDQVAPFLF